MLANRFVQRVRGPKRPVVLEQDEPRTRRAIKVVARNSIDRAYVLAKRSKVPFHLAFIDEAFSAPSRGPFDSDYMKTLFEFGYAQGKSGLAFHDEPPDLSPRPNKAAR